MPLQRRIQRLRSKVGLCSGVSNANNADRGDGCSADRSVPHPPSPLQHTQHHVLSLHIVVVAVMLSDTLIPV